MWVHATHGKPAEIEGELKVHLPQLLIRALELTV